jgi:hypothetical protein
MTNKNPFELRTEVLAMAKDYMDQSYHMNADFARQMFEQGKKTVEEMQAAFTPYDIKDLVAKAQEMYGFITKKD